MGFHYYCWDHSDHHFIASRVVAVAIPSMYIKCNTSINKEIASTIPQNKQRIWLNQNIFVSNYFIIAELPQRILSCIFYVQQLKSGID